MAWDLIGMYACGGAGPDSASLPLCLWSSPLLKAQQPVHLWDTLVGAFKVTATNGGPGGKDVPRHTNGALVASCPDSNQNMLSLRLPICPASHGFSLMRFQLAGGFGVEPAQQLDEACGQKYPEYPW